MDSEPLRNELLTSQWYGISPGNINYTGGNVGIGVASVRTSPRFWSANDVTLVSGNYAGDVSCQIAAVGYTNPDKRLALMYDTTNNIGLVQAMIYGTGTSPLCLNAAGGNVGIGLINPGYLLDVNGTIATRTDIRFNGTGLNAVDKKLYSPADGDLEWMTNTGAGVRGFAVSHQGTKIVYLSTSGNSYLNGGNVGVGTNNPQAPFHVYKSGGGGVVQGEIRVCSDDNQKSRVGMYEESAGSTWGCWMQYNGNGDTMEFGSKRNTVDTAPQMTISSTGTVNVPGVITNQGKPMSLVGKNNGDISTGTFVFNSVAYNIGSMYSTTNGRWTASVAGYYQFTYAGLSAYTTTGPNMRWYKNGGDFGWGAMHFNMGTVTGAYHLQTACSVIIFLAVNDYVEFYSITNGFYGQSTIHSSACCILLG